MSEGIKKTAANAWAALKEYPNLVAKIKALETKGATLEAEKGALETERNQLKDACTLLVKKNSELADRLGKSITAGDEATNAARSVGYDRGFRIGHESGVESMSIGNRLKRLLGLDD